MVDLLIRMSANILTIINVILGTCSIIFTLNDNCKVAGILILVAVVMDGMDGRVARKLDSASEFGKNLDSLCDLVSFGVAPAILLYALYLIKFDILGIAVAVFFVVCGALRLARFNVSSATLFFTGVPITIAGGLIVLSSMIITNGIWNIFIITFLSVMMISTIKIPKLR